jgi:hypothetical protein
MGMLFSFIDAVLKPQPFENFHFEASLKQLQQNIYYFSRCSQLLQPVPVVDLMVGASNL